VKQKAQWSQKAPFNNGTKIEDFEWPWTA